VLSAIAEAPNNLPVLFGNSGSCKSFVAKPVLACALKLQTKAQARTARHFPRSDTAFFGSRLL
jgi:hypothetical protein